VPQLTAIDGGFDQLGEGPIWNDRTCTLWHVDILGHVAYSWHPSTGERNRFEQSGEVSAVMLGDDGSIIVAVEHALVRLGAEASPQVLATAEEDRGDNRFSDCRIDPNGRLWAGTLNRARLPHRAALYRLDGPGLLTVVEHHCTVANGIGWSLDGTQMYFVDTMTGRIDVFDADIETADVTGRRPFAAIDPDDGRPDGLAVDAEGGVWVALFGGGAVRRYGDDGSLDEIITLPVTYPTCPTFGGDALDTMFVTSARYPLNGHQLAAEPLAGAMFAVTETGVLGQPANRFATALIR
jgi:sugar lactone lactonase YvrE